MRRAGLASPRYTSHRYVISSKVMKETPIGKTT